MEEVTPETMRDFEEELQRLLDELGRLLLEAVLNRLAAAPASEKVLWEGTTYRRLKEPTSRRGKVATLFGQVALLRQGYRDTNSDRRIQGEKTIFPLEMQLGLIEGATPALASEVGQLLASTGATQLSVLGQLQRRHHVSWGATRLRKLADHLSAWLSPHREAEQAKQLVRWLKASRESKGKHRPALVLGRDGITLATRESAGYEVASTATFTVYDRGQQRQGTLYLAATPESGQGELSRAMTSLLEATLRLDSGPLPRLRYLTDAGDNETAYFERVLSKLGHPVTGKSLECDWIVDYYHASQRLTTLAEALFTPGREAESWAKKMRKWLLKPKGAYRVLHSAAALKAKRALSQNPRKSYQIAYQYLRDRLPHLDYHRAKSQGLPIGSGVTEAACKTIFTQRLKLSGMRWSHAGAQTILNLRVIQLSGVWDNVFGAALRTLQPPFAATEAQNQKSPQIKAA